MQKSTQHVKTATCRFESVYITYLYDDLPNNIMPCLGRRQSHDYHGAHMSVIETLLVEHMLFSLLILHPRGEPTCQ